MQSIIKEGLFGETSFRATIEQIEPGKIVAGIRLDLGYEGVSIEFPGLQKDDGKGMPYVSWRLPLRNPDQIDNALRTVFTEDLPPGVLQGATEVINDFSSSLT